MYEWVVMIQKVTAIVSNAFVEEPTTCTEPASKNEKPSVCSQASLSTEQAAGRVQNKEVVTSWSAGVRPMPSRRRQEFQWWQSMADHKRVSTGGDGG